MQLENESLCQLNWNFMSVLERNDTFYFIWAFQVIEKSLLYYCDAIVVEFIFVCLMPKKVNIGRCFFDTCVSFHEFQYIYSWRG